MSPDETDFLAYRYTRGLVRLPGAELTGALSRDGTAADIDVGLARAQHARYREILMGLGIDLIEISADPAFPDGSFVEDTCVILPGCAVITAPGAPSRTGETRSVEEAIRPHMEINRLAGGGTLDGGDVLRLGRTYLIGQSGRTSRDAAIELGRMARLRGADYRVVRVDEGLHLKSAVTPLSPSAVLGVEPILSDPAFDGVQRIAVPTREAAAACALAANGAVVLADGFPETKERLTRAGYSVIVCDISQFAKADGGLTCLSVLW